MTWVPAEHLTDPAVVAAFTTTPVRGHDVKSLMRSLLTLGIDLPNLELDTAIAAYLLDPAEAAYGLPQVVERYTRFAAPADEPAAKGQLDLDGVTADPATSAGREALAVHHLVEPITSSLRDQGMADLYATIENPLVRVLARMERAGIAVDLPELRRLHERLSADVVRLQAELKQVVGRDDLNINSPIQLRELLYAAPPLGRGLTPVKRTKTGPSTDAATLEKLRDEWPEFIGPLLQYREVEKLRGTYGEGLLAEVAPDGRIHATFNQTVARTGPPQLGPSEPAQHPGPPRRGSVVPSGLHRRAGRPVAGRRLQPDRAALHRPPRRRPRARRRVHERRGHPQRHGLAGVRRRPGRRHARPALEGQDGVVRPGLRDGGLRVGSAPEHPDRRGGDRSSRPTSWPSPT